MNKPRIVLLASALLVAGLLCACDHPRNSPVAAEKPLLVLDRSGGIAGFQDHLVIGYHGQYYLAQGQQELIGTLSAETTSWLTERSSHLAPFTLRLEDNPGGPDNMVRQVMWTGLGNQVATQAEQQEILTWGVDLLASLVSRQ
jgi:hypothetical protein